jgi:hypothetical protein
MEENSPNASWLFTVMMWIPLFLEIVAPLPWNKYPDWYLHVDADELPTSHHHALDPLFQIRERQLRLNAIIVNTGYAWCLVARSTALIAGSSLLLIVPSVLDQNLKQNENPSETVLTMKRIIVLAHIFYTFWLALSIFMLIAWRCSLVVSVRGYADTAHEQPPAFEFDNTDNSHESIFELDHVDDDGSLTDGTLSDGTLSGGALLMSECKYPVTGPMTHAPPILIRPIIN